MDSEPNTSRRKIRTFAEDIEIAKMKRGDSGSKKTSSKKKVFPQETPKQAPVKAVPNPKKLTEEEPAKQTPPKKNTAVPKATIPKPPAPKPHKAPTKVPAFHEIQKRNDATHKKDGAISKSTIGYDSTIITDTKADRFNLGKSVIESVSTWFKNIAKRRKRRTPVYTVPSVEHRKGIIKEATTKTGAAFTADSKELRGRIKMRQQQQKMQEEIEDAETFWSPYTETGQRLLEAPDEALDKPHNVQLEFKKKTIAPTAPETKEDTRWSSSHDLESTEKTMPTPEPDTEETVAPQAPTPIPPYIEPTPSPVPEPAPISEPKTDIATTPPEEPKAPTEPEIQPEEPEDVPQTPVTPREHPQQVVYDSFTSQNDDSKSSMQIQRVDTNTLTFSFLFFLALLALLTYGGLLVFKEVTKPTTAPTFTFSTEPLLANSEVKNVILSTNNINSVAGLLLRNAATGSPAVSELPLTSASGEEISPAYLFQILNFNTVPSLRYSINQARFIAVNNQRPSLLLQFSDYEMIFGGLLSWEESLSDDFRKLYETPVDAKAFSDKSISGHDVRILRHNGEVVLLYGFVNDSTVVISPTESDFVKISQLITTP